VAVNFTRYLTLRLETIEFNKYDNGEFSGNGGYSFSLFSDLDADVILSAPIRYRIAPLVYAGMYFAKFMDKPANDPRGIAMPAELRIGLGALYRLQEKSKLQFELQIYEMRQYAAEPYPGVPGAFYYESEYCIGINRVNLGYYYEF
jgi:hypothetical protein